MKNIVIKTLAGNTIPKSQTDQTPATLKDYAIDCLMVTEKDQSGASKLECDTLARKLLGLTENQEIELSANEIVLLRKRLEKYAITLVWGQCQEKGIIE